MAAHKDGSGRVEDCLQKFTDGMAMAIKELDQEDESQKIVVNYKPGGISS